MDSYEEDLAAPESHYWAHVRQGRFAVQECASCGGRFAPPRRWCRACGDARVRWVFPDLDEMQGVLYSFTVVHRAPSPDLADEVPYAIGMASLSGLTEESRLYARVVDVEDDESLHVGMPVQVALRTVGRDLLPVLVPGARHA